MSQEKLYDIITLIRDEKETMRKLKLELFGDDGGIDMEKIDEYRQSQKRLNDLYVIPIVTKKSISV